MGHCINQCIVHGHLRLCFLQGIAQTLLLQGIGNVGSGVKGRLGARLEFLVYCVGVDPAVA